MKNRVIFTRHALEKLRERHIPKTLVLQTINDCEKMVYEYGYYYAFHKWKRCYLKVVFKREGETIFVITQYFIDHL